MVGQQQTPPLPTSIKFSHALHAKLGDISPVLRASRKSGSHLRPGKFEPGAGCQACHSSVAVDQSRDHLSIMGDCLVCHTKINAPFSCGFCHNAPGRSLKPATHSVDFLDRHTSGIVKLNLEKSDCAVCHGRKFTCLGCH